MESGMEGMLESAINTPLQIFDSSDLYPAPVDKIEGYHLNLRWIIRFMMATKESLPKSLM